MALNIQTILEMVLLILIYLYLFPTVLTASSTATGTSFENESALIKALVGLIPVIYLFAPFGAIIGYIKWGKK